MEFLFSASVSFLIKSSGSFIQCCPSVWFSLVGLSLVSFSITLDTIEHISFCRNIVGQFEKVATGCCILPVGEQPSCRTVHRSGPPARNPGHHGSSSSTLWWQQHLQPSTARRPLPHALPLHTILQVQFSDLLWLQCTIFYTVKCKLITF